MVGRSTFAAYRTKRYPCSRTHAQLRLARAQERIGLDVGVGIELLLREVGPVGLSPPNLRYIHVSALDFASLAQSSPVTGE